MRTTTATRDLGDDVIYAIGRSATATLLVLNSRPVSRLNRQHSQEVRATSEALRAQSAELRRARRSEP